MAIEEETQYDVVARSNIIYNWFNTGTIVFQVKRVAYMNF